MMGSRNQKGDATSTPQKVQSFQSASPDFAPFAVMSVELQPGLPKVNDPLFSDLSPPAYIPYSGGKRNANTNSSKKQNNYNQRGNGKSKIMTPKRDPNYAGESWSGRQANSNLKPFQLVSPLPFAINSVPIRGIKNENGVIKYPLILCSQEGTVMVSMAAGVIVELCLDRSFRVVCNSDFMAYVNSNGSVSSILHTYAKIVHGKEHVHCKFTNTNDRMAVLGPEGILFSMESLAEAYLLSSANVSGPSAIALEKPEFPIQNIDYTIQQMYTESNMGVNNIEKCNSVMQKAVYEKYADGTLVVHINDMLLKSNSETGEIVVEAKPVKLSVNPLTLTVQLRSTHIDMAIQDKDKCYVKRADKRIHTSRSGMVVSDGTCTISMDQCGRILSCS